MTGELEQVVMAWCTISNRRVIRSNDKHVFHTEVPQA